MLDDPRLLVVDDEEAICEGCRRIFTRQGFQVEKTSDAVRGLTMAADGRFSAILLDIMMPEMDGLQFLKALRATNADVPVILMTGYPSLPNAISAVRLGASDFVTKPFTPEEISQAVHKFVRKLPQQPRKAEEPWAPSDDGATFFDRAWLQPGKDGAVRVGMLLPRAEAAGAKVTRVPGIADIVYQGLPIAEITLADGTRRMVPSPVSGLIVTANQQLLADSTALASSPCADGWIASISATRFEEETRNCARRPIVLFNPDAASARVQREKLAAYGCQVRFASRWEELAPMLENQGTRVIVMDAVGFGDEGPALVARINTAAPTLRVVLVAGEGTKLEAAYRQHRIFYYAVAPFADNEIAEILDAAFRTTGASAPAEQRRAPAGPLCGLTITNRHGTKVKLLAGPDLLRREDGLGAVIRHKFLDKLFPMESLSGTSDLSPSALLKAADACDRLVVLLVKDTGHLPGSLIRDTKAEFVSLADSTASKVTILVVQPDAQGKLDSLERATLSALAEQIVVDMSSY